MLPIGPYYNPAAGIGPIPYIGNGMSGRPNPVTNLYNPPLGKINFSTDAISRATGISSSFLTRMGFEPGSDPSGSSGQSGQYIYNYSSPRTFEYINADLAKQYGMNKVTAYNEAMANTAYQRAVADMQQAGLNPASIFGGGHASVAGTGRASGGSSGGFSSARGASQGDQLPGWIFYGAQALAQAVGTLVTGNPSTGFVSSQVVGNLMRAFNGR